ncbi:MAG: CHAD domain-containing protein [Vicinamibacterales bacterium]
MPISRSRDEIFGARVEAFTRALGEVEQGEARAIHRTRVASRRLREMVPVLQLDRDDCRRLMRILREVTRALGVLREADVLLALVEDLRHERRKSGRALDVVHERLRAERLARLADARRAHIGRRLQRAGQRLEKTARRLEAETPRGARRRWLWAVDARIARRAAAVAHAVDAAGSLYLPERLHEVRKAVKKLRYAAELHVEAVPSDRRVTVSSLRRWQDLLGTLHDRQVLMERIRRLQADGSATADRTIRQQFDVILARLEDECRLLHGRYLKGRRGLLAQCERLATRHADRPARAVVTRSLRTDRAERAARASRS